MRRTLIYTLVGLLAPLVTLLLLPVYLNYLTTSEYVILSLSNSFIAVFSIFFNLKIDQAMRTIYFYNSDDSDKQKQLFRTLFSFQVISFVVWLLVFFIIGNSLFSIIYKNVVPFFPYTFIILSSFLVNALCGFYYIYLQNKAEVVKYSTYLVGSTLLINGLQLLCIFYLKLDFIWFLIAPLIANSFIFLIIYLTNSSLFKFQISRPILIEALRFSIPFIPFLIIYNLENQLDRFFIDRFLTIEELAKYVVLLSIASVISTLFNSVDNAIRPELFALFSNEKNSKKLQFQFDFYLMIGLLSLSFLVFFGIHIHWFLDNPKYNGVAPYFPMIGIAFLPMIFLRFFALQLIYEKKVSKMNAYSAIKIIIMALLFWVLIPKFGIPGAIITLAVSNFLNALLFSVLLNNKTLPRLKIIFYCTTFLILNLALCFIENAYLLSLVSTFLLILFGGIFLLNYKTQIINYFYKPNTNES
jgi:O-antigen/teichoic acid export membrane protein